MRGFLAAIVAAIMSLFGAQQPSQTPAASVDTRTALATAQHGENLLSRHLAAAAVATANPTTPSENVESTGSNSPTAPNSATTAAAAAVSNGDSAPDPSRYVTKAELNAALDQRFASLAALAPALQQLVAAFPRSTTAAAQTNTVYVPSFSGGGSAVPNYANAFGLSQRIDNLSGTSLSNISVNGVSGLTDADIPDGITASNYLPLTGGSLTGDLTMTGTLTAGALSVSAVSSGGAVEAPYFTATSTTDNSIFAGNVSVGTTTSPSFALDVYATGGSDVPLRITSNHPSFTRLFINNTGGGDSQVGFLANGSTKWSTGYEATTGGFAIANSYELTGNAKLIVTPTGNVGIGTTSPQSKLDIWQTSVTSNNFLTLTNTSNQSAGKSGINWYSSQGARTEARISSTPGGGYADPSLYFEVSDSGGTLQDQVVIKSSGNVGIGTTSPASKLAVSGGASIGADYNTAAPSNGLIIQGNVGIGTTSPAGKLDIKADSGQTGINSFRVPNNSGAFTGATVGTWLGFSRYSDATTFGGALGVGNNTNFYINSQSGSGITITTNTGNVGIGTGLAAVSKFGVSGNAAVGATYGALSAPTSGMIIEGNVGIGTTSPASKLAVSGGASIGADYNTAAPSNGLIIQGNVGIGTTGPLSKLDVNGGLAVGSYAGTNAAPSNGAIISGNVGIGTTTPWGKLSITGSGTGTGIAFAVANSANSPKVVVQDNGNVGIGTTSPGAKLHVVGSALLENAGTVTLTLNDSSNTQIPTITFQQSGTTRASIQAGRGTNNILDFFTGGSNRVTIEDSGNVGIGTTSPQYKLDVAGGGVSSVHISPSGGSDTGLYLAAAGGGNSILSSNAQLNGSWVAKSTNASIFLANGNTGQFDFYNGTGLTAGNTFTPTSLMTIQPNGNVGIGTTNPGAKLHVAGADNTDAQAIVQVAGTNGQIPAFYGRSSRGTISSPLPSQNGDTMLSLGGQAYTTGWSGPYTSIAMQVDGSFNGAAGQRAPGRIVFTTNPVGGVGAEAMRITSTGNVGIGTVSPSSFKLQVAGNVGPDANTTYDIGSTALRWGCIWTSGGSTGTCASDERLKDNIADVAWSSDPLAELAGLRARTFTFKDDPNHTQTYGVIAQEAETVAPELVITDASTTLKKVKYGAIQWLVFSAVQELIAKVTDIANTVASFADRFVTKELVATNGTFDKVSAKELCVGATCVTEDQLKALLNGQNTASGSQTAAAAGATSTEPPVLEIQGNNPAHVDVGASYSDLGAIITGPTQADTNLGIHLFLDGAAVPSITLDTQEPGEHTIDYVATNAAGTSTSTRTVIIEAPSAPTPPPPTPLSATTTATSTPSQ